MNAVALTRPAVQFVLDQLDLDRVLAQIDDPTRYAVDEFLFPSLQATADLLGMPGGFTGDGVRQKINAPLITRFFICFIQ
jgi:hypothetical protein